MPLITLSNGCLAYGHVPLLDHAVFQLDPNERVALIGRNGTGKSSLLAACAGVRHLDDGELWRAPGLKLAHVPQEPEFDVSMRVFDAVVAGMGEVSQLLADYHAVSHQLTEAGDHDTLLEKLHDLQAALDVQGAWSYASQAERVIERFSLDADALVGALSGGQKKRVALARAMVSAPDVLLLDEPTNHLDIDAIAWLEQTLIESRMAIVFITHDRRFLERVATRIVELDRGSLLSFPCSFAEYQQRKLQMLQDEAVQNRKFDKLLKEEEVWIRKGVEARRTRAVYRVQRLQTLREERAQRRERVGQVSLQVETGAKSGQLVAELEKVNKRFGDKIVLRDFSCRIMRGDRVGVIGPNGAGKTTLLKIILGELLPDSGRVKRGTHLTAAYFDQFREVLDPEAALADVISPGSDYVEIGNARKHVIGYLGEFLFAPERARSPVKSLSGGERNRLLLARLFARPANVLVLDEPTNDLDIDTLELLEQLLLDYPGTLFLVSHDRAFLDNVVTQVIAAEGEGLWCENAGGYDDWMAFKKRQQREREDAARTSKPAKSKQTATPSVPASTTKSVRLSFKEQKELDALPARISAVEQEQKLLLTRLEDFAVYSRPDEARKISSRLGTIENELAELMDRWVELESRTEA